MPHHHNDARRGIVRSYDIYIFVVWSHGGHLSLTYVQQSGSTNRFRRNGQELCSRFPVNRMLYEERVRIHGALILQDAIQHQHHGVRICDVAFPFLPAGEREDILLVLAVRFVVFALFLSTRRSLFYCCCVCCFFLCFFFFVEVIIYTTDMTGLEMN